MQPLKSSLLRATAAAALAAIKVFEESQPFGKAFLPDRVGLVAYTRPILYSTYKALLTFSWSF